MARDRSRRPDAKALRLFVAVEVSDEAKAAAGDAIAPLRTRFPKARWVPPQNQHVTLKFLGQTWPRLEGWVRERIAEAAATRSPFELRLDRLGAFRSPRSARVLWVGLSDEPGGALAETAAAIEEALAAEFPPERRPFAAHLTLARSDPPLALDPTDVEVPVTSVAWRVDRLTLFRSHLGRPAPRYEVLATFPLGLHT